MGILSSTNTGKKALFLFPKTKIELRRMISNAIKEKGYECSLNHIDVSEITDMSYMFYCSKFNGDISKLNVSNVKDMYGMFALSNFKKDISSWKINPKCETIDMFYKCPIIDEYKPKNNKITI